MVSRYDPSVSHTRLLSATRIEERLRSQADLEQDKGNSVVSSIGDTVYWLIFLLFLPAILGALALEGLLDPVRGMTQDSPWLPA